MAWRIVGYLSASVFYHEYRERLKSHFQYSGHIKVCCVLKASWSRVERTDLRGELQKKRVAASPVNINCQRGRCFQELMRSGPLLPMEARQSWIVNLIWAMEKKLRIIPGLYGPTHWMINTWKSQILLWMLNFINFILCCCLLLCCYCCHIVLLLLERRTHVIPKLASIH